MVNQWRVAEWTWESSAEESFLQAFPEAPVIVGQDIESSPYPKREKDLGLLNLGWYREDFRPCVGEGLFFIGKITKMERMQRNGAFAMVLAQENGLGIQ